MNVESDRQHNEPAQAERATPPSAVGRPSRDGWVWIAGIGCGIALLLCLCVAGGVLLYSTLVDAGPRATVTPPASSGAPGAAVLEAAFLNTFESLMLSVFDAREQFGALVLEADLDDPLWAEKFGQTLDEMERLHRAAHDLSPPARHRGSYDTLLEAMDLYAEMTGEVRRSMELRDVDLLAVAGGKLREADRHLQRAVELFDAE